MVSPEAASRPHKATAEKNKHCLNIEGTILNAAGFDKQSLRQRQGRLWFFYKQATPDWGLEISAVHAAPGICRNPCPGLNGFATERRRGAGRQSPIRHRTHEGCAATPPSPPRGRRT